jgi:D-3-phosphoglycerate dehydrogenase / 2-oxoglutarate reductase
MSRFRVLLTDRAWPETTIEDRLLGEVGAELIEPPATGEAGLVSVAKDVDAIATNWAKVTDAVIRAAPKCRIIARTGIGVDNIAIPTATELRIPVTNVPDYCVAEVADHTLGLLLACARRIGFFHHRTKRGEYDLQAATPMRRLSTQTLGLFGLGHIGRAVAVRARALGLNVISHTASGKDHGTGCAMVPLDTLLADSDFLSLHAPLTDSTRQVINGAALAKMKPTAYLINTSRGGLIDEAALWTALQQNRLAGAALDVFDPEPPDLSQPLFQDERVIVTPHAAFVSEESLTQMRTQALEGIVAALSGRRPQNVLNPQIYSPPE